MVTAHARAVGGVDDAGAGRATMISVSRFLGARSCSSSSGRSSAQVLPPSSTTWYLDVPSFITRAARPSSTTTRHGAAHPERDRNARVRGCAAVAASWAGLRRVRGLVCRYRHVADVGASLYCPYSRLVAVATAYSLFLACLLVLPWARWPCVAACHALGPFARAGGVCYRCLWGTVGTGAQFWVWWTGLKHVRPLESSVGEGGRGI